MISINLIASLLLFFSDTNQNAAILSRINEHQIAIALDPTFKIHPHHPFSIKRIIQL
jgi:hypothetical protein